jgi:urate oxidase/2-oxo-4-hydroxy-4-carboxy-5-ureidoimidazoline decarboxylase
MSLAISYGKLAVPLQWVELGGPRPLFACEVSVEVLGENFEAAYTEGDNANVVATDTMKNVILRRALEWDGATLEGLLLVLGREFLASYPVMESLRISGEEVPFVPAGGSDRLFRRVGADRAVASLDLGPDGITDHDCGRRGLELLKTTGSAFRGFARDEDTTLEERGDRPLFVGLDVGWRYADPDVLADPADGGYVAPETVRALVEEVFHGFVSESIQHLVHEMGRRALERFPSLAQVSFRARNQTFDLVAEAGETRRVYAPPFPATGLITLTLERT